MVDRNFLPVMVLLIAMTMAAQAHDESKYPDWKGQWSRSTGPAQWDPKKPAGLRQEPPLTNEYQGIWEANMASQASGGEGYNPQAFCLPSGMPRMMIACEPLEIIVTAETTYVRVDHLSEFRRIYTDRRSWPDVVDPTYAGYYSIGTWIATDGDGRYDLLEVETRFEGAPHI